VGVITLLLPESARVDTVTPLPALLLLLLPVLLVLSVRVGVLAVMMLSVCTTPPVRAHCTVRAPVILLSARTDCAAALPRGVLGGTKPANVKGGVSVCEREINVHTNTLHNIIVAPPPPPYHHHHHHQHTSLTTQHNIDLGIADVSITRGQRYVSVLDLSS
jgi:hypothetical protein